LIVCGDDMLAFRVAQELTTRYRERVTAILPSKRRGQGPQIDRLPGTRIVEQDELTSQAFTDAQITSARALALLRQDDVGNFHAALRARELNPDIRLVVAVFSPGLGEQVRAFFPDCAVLVGTSMSAPSFVAAALGEPAPSHVRVSGRTLFVARPEDTDPAQVLCGLAAPSASGGPMLLPRNDQTADLVLAVADGTPRNPLSRQRRRRLTSPLRLLHRLFWHRMGIAFAALLAVLGLGYVLLAVVRGYSAVNALYLTFLDAAGAAVTNPKLSGPEKTAQFLLTFDGMAFLPLVTAAIVSARIPGAVTAARAPLSGHVIVAGLGSVGTKVVGQLNDLGVEVVGIDKSGTAAGMAMAERLGIRVVVGETHREETLRAADIGTCQAVVSVTDSDIVNLETALNARALAATPRIVVRLYDDDLAERVQRTIGGTVSRSTSYLAAPAFAAAVLDHQVLRTIAVGRHVLLIAEAQVGDDTGLAGMRIADVHAPGLLRAIALRRAGEPDADWSPDGGYRLQPGDRLVVLATRAGLSRVLRPEIVG
jgi:Trk K+ transport system NAD-binding subunit